MKSKMAILAIGLLVLGASASNAGATGSFSIGVDGGASLPSGTYGDYANTGWHAGGTGTYMLNPQWGLGADINYHSWGGSDALNATLPSGDTFSWSTIQATPNVQFHIPTQTSIKPYAVVGVGLYDIRGKHSSSSGSTSDSKSKMGFNFGGGMDMVSGSSMSWGVDTAYHIVSAQNDVGTDINNITFGLHMKWGMGGK
jgi:outer membrane protein W